MMFQMFNNNNNVNFITDYFQIYNIVNLSMEGNLQSAA